MHKLNSKCFVIAIFAFNILIAALDLAGSRRDATLATENVRKEFGHAYNYNIHNPGFPFAIPDDSPRSSHASKLILYENDRPMGPSHSLHDDVRWNGHGAYSHWEGTLYFSASDNSDPRTNGRTYSVRYPVRISARAWGLLVFLEAAILFVLSSGGGLILLGGLFFIFQGLLFYDDALINMILSAVGLTAFQNPETFPGSGWLGPVPGATDLICGVLMVAFAFIYKYDKVRNIVISCGKSERLLIAICFFCVALLVRGLNWAIFPDLTVLGFSIAGTPFSDAWGWFYTGTHIAKGTLFDGSIPETMLSLRLFYPVVLGLLFTWAGPSVFLAKLLGIVADSFSVALVYLIGEKVSNRAVGIALSIAVLGSAEHVSQSLVTSTESVGNAMIALSLLMLILCCKGTKSARFVWPGLVVALSNLTRPLTIGAIPGYGLCILYLWRRNRIEWKKAVYGVVFFLLGVALAFGPWIVKQKMMHGVATISTNTADAFYAATSPQYGHWAPEVEKELKVHGIGHSIKERYEFFMREGLKNLKSNPLFYVKNVARSFVEYLRGFDSPALILNSVPLILMFLGLIVARSESAPLMRRLATAVLMTCIIGLQIVTPQKIAFLWLAVAMIIVIILDRRRYSVLLANTLLFSGIALAMLGLGGMDRLTFGLTWMALFFFLGFWFHLAEIAQREAGKDSQAVVPCVASSQPLWGAAKEGAAWPHRLEKSLKIIGIAALAFAVLSGVRLFYLNVWPPEGNPGSRALTVEEERQVTDWAEHLFPTVYGTRERSVTPPDHKNTHQNQSRPTVAVGRIVYGPSWYLPAGRPVATWLNTYAYLSERDYDRTDFLFASPQGGYIVIFPGRLPDEFTEKEAILVGRFSSEGQNSICEGIALIPFSTKTRQIDFEKAWLAKDERHLKFVEGLKK